MSSKTKQYDIQTTTYKTAGTASAYTLIIPKLTSLVDEFTFVVEFHVENDASATLNINSLWAIAIMTSEGNTVDAGDLKTTGRYTLVYDQDTARFVVSETVTSQIEEEVQTVVGSIPSTSTFRIWLNYMGSYEERWFGDWWATDDINYTPTYMVNGWGGYWHQIDFGVCNLMWDLVRKEAVWGWDNPMYVYGACVFNGYLYAKTYLSWAWDRFEKRGVTDLVWPATHMTFSWYVLNVSDVLLWFDWTYLLLGRGWTTDVRRFSDIANVMTYVDTITAPFTINSQYYWLQQANANWYYVSTYSSSPDQYRTTHYTYGWVASSPRQWRNSVAANDGTYLSLARSQTASTFDPDGSVVNFIYRAF